MFKSLKCSHGLVRRHLIYVLALWFVRFRNSNAGYVQFDSAYVLTYATSYWMCTFQWPTNGLFFVYIIYLQIQQTGKVENAVFDYIQTHIFPSVNLHLFRLKWKFSIKIIPIKSFFDKFLWWHILVHTWRFRCQFPLRLSYWSSVRGNDPNHHQHLSTFNDTRVRPHS